MNRVFASSPNVLSHRLLLGQNVFHAGPVMMANVDPGGLAAMRTGDLPGFADGFHEFFRPSDYLPQVWSESGEFLRKLASADGMALSDNLLPATLALESRILSLAGHHDEIGYCAADRAPGDDPGDSIVLIWETADPALSREVLAVALSGIAELAGALGSGQPTFARALDRLEQWARARRLDPATGVLQAAAKECGVPCHLSDGALTLGEGARQRQPFGPSRVVPFTTCREDHGPRATGNGPDTPFDRDAARVLIDRLFPERDAARIPSLVFAGDRATSAAARQAGAMLTDAGRRVGMALKQGVLVEGNVRAVPDGRITRAAAMLLRDGDVDALVTALSLRRVVNYGLGFSRCDGVALQLEPCEDAGITRSGAEVLVRACAGPFTIDAGHPAAGWLAGQVGHGRLILVARAPDAPSVADHVAQGGLIATRQWGAEGPQVRLLWRDGVLASAPLESRARTRERLIYAGMHAFALVQAAALGGDT